MRTYTRHLALAAAALAVLVTTTSPADAQYRPRPGMMPRYAAPPRPFYPMPSPSYFPSPYATSPYAFSPYAMRPFYPNAVYSPYPTYPGAYPYMPMMYSYPPMYSSGYAPYSGGYTAPSTAGYTPPSTYQANREEEPNTVTVYDGFFKPAEITVTAGTTVRWTNTGKHRHTVTSDTGRWDSGDLDSGGTFTHTFTEPGRYTYHCTHHRAEMRGLVIVK